MKALFKLDTLICIRYIYEVLLIHLHLPQSEASATSGTTNDDKTHGNQCYYNALTARVGPVLQYSKRILLELWNVPVAHHAGNK